MLGHGELQGPFTELAGLTIERDPRFPVRVTVQFYQATSSGRVTPAELGKLAGLIDAVYTRGDFVGSLVVPGPARPAPPHRLERRRPGPGLVEPVPVPRPGRAVRRLLPAPAPAHRNPLTVRPVLP